MSALATTRPFPVRAIVVAAVVVGLGAGCSEMTVDVLDDVGPVSGDSTLPDGFVADNRPEAPPLGQATPCPLGTVPGGFGNDAVTLGCPFHDCIPAIDNPRFINIDEASANLLDAERILVVERHGEVRGVPIRILIYHEVVSLCWNGDGDEQYSFVTYCPIVDVAVHFLPPAPIRDLFACGYDGVTGSVTLLRPKRFSYGVSSGIYNGNLIVYQRGTAGDTTGVYVQMYGGGLNETCLEMERVNIDMSWNMFRRLYPSGLVMSQDTGNAPQGGYDIIDHPYADFWRSNDFCVNGLCFPLSHEDGRLRPKTPIYGVYTRGERKAYRISFGNRGWWVVNDVVGDQNIVVWSDRRFDSTTGYEALVDGQILTFDYVGRERHGLPLYRDRETESIWTFDGIAVSGPLHGRRLPPVLGHRSFWFAWAAFFPETRLHEF